MGVLYTRIYKLVAIGTSFSRICMSRQNWCKSVFNENKATYDLEHRLVLVILTIKNACFILAVASDNGFLDLVGGTYFSKANI